MNQDQAQRLPRSLVLLHWLLAASVFFLFASSWMMLSLPLPSDIFTYRELPFQLHKNIGLTLVLLILAMIAVRLQQRTRLAAQSRSRLRKLADLEHLLTYLLLLACCLSGYLSSSYSGWTTTWWWLIDLPVWSEESDELNILFSDIHLWTCWALLAAIALHVGAALHHAFADDGEVNRMFQID